MNIGRGEVQDFADSHAAPGHQFQHQPVSSFCRTEDDLINRLLIDDVPLDRLGSLKDLSDDGCVAWIGKRRQGGVDAEIVEGCQNRISILLFGLLVVLRQRKQKFENLFLRYAGPDQFAKSGREPGKDELTGFDGIFLELAL